MELLCGRLLGQRWALNQSGNLHPFAIDEGCGRGGRRDTGGLATLPGKNMHSVLLRMLSAPTFTGTRRSQINECKSCYALVHN